MDNKIVRQVSAFNSELKLKGFNVFQIEADGSATKTYSRKDFYKICLTTGKSKIHYADRSFEQEGTVLFFGNLFKFLKFYVVMFESLLVHLYLLYIHSVKQVNLNIIIVRS